ncbi:L-threonylcarbamoyladenylate synthase [Lutispora sp.]|uniref:L-threonylcarbamoyladenylate synthase n=1 Tax=Lutispora sp. TaxID=2828727 RepID=UPI000ED62DAF|nr:L-threonylcarbamoyladenylate synthase [Lutispora sp.]MEA4962773.1 L-threonylcarbamoyladenylate synthase [Lutispora sp.]HCJ56907.1 threonylcarbamoyl-AMP synthase [Clostridiaceae bacterium]
MKTKVYYFDDKNINDEALDEAATVIRQGGTVIFPTETVYGLGANALDEKSVSRIFEAKGRPSDNPLIVHISNYDMLLYCIGEPLSEKAQKLMAFFWPGPLTIIFKKSKAIPGEVTAGLDTVAIRMPDDEIALSLIEKSGVPIAAPSANISGKPSPTAPEHVIADMDGKVDVILCSRSTRVGVESTVIDISEDTPVVLRPGGVTLEELSKVLGDVETDKGLEPGSIPKSPGMKYTHYAPKAPMAIIRGDEAKVRVKILELASKDRDRGLKVGILTVDEGKDSYPGYSVISIGSRRDSAEAAHNLFNALREFDKLAVDTIYAEAISEEYLGLAVMNRMKKAAGFNIIEV